ncbi:hypothetical protein I3271_06965 [Photobacterium leiognathi]|uniref:hypothetical protein n=1 Tax=Photobacterium leiognathi TaxID=553611 RepID=UPI001EDE1433|nr:hypothetical protein [Photobacterium leiognathi]MCG3884426.1 hypothetical protein [Photobacterium leiognathi]
MSHTRTNNIKRHLAIHLEHFWLTWLTVIFCICPWVFYAAVVRGKLYGVWGDTGIFTGLFYAGALIVPMAWLYARGWGYYRFLRSEMIEDNSPSSLDSPFIQLISVAIISAIVYYSGALYPVFYLLEACFVNYTIDPTFGAEDYVVKFLLFF